MFLKLAAVLLLAQVAFAQMPSGVDEQTLYQAVYPLDQYAQGYGQNEGNGRVERIDNTPVELPVQEETRQGQDQTMDHQLQDERREARVDQTKEIHNYQVQRRIVNVNNRILHRYLKNLLVNVIYNTNIQRVNHQKLINLLLTTLQETHQPKLLVKYSRQDTTNDLGERTEQPDVSEDRQDKVLPPIFVPATAEKIGYDGLALGGGVGAGGFSGSSSGAGFSGSSSSGFSGAGMSGGRFGSFNGLGSTGSAGAGFNQGFSGSSMTGGGYSGSFPSSSGSSGFSGSSGRNFGNFGGSTGAGYNQGFSGSSGAHFSGQGAHYSGSQGF